MTMPQANHPDAVLIGLARERGEAMRGYAVAVAAADVDEPDPKHEAALEAAEDRENQVEELIFQETPKTLAGLLVKLAPAADEHLEIQWSQLRRALVDESTPVSPLMDVMVQGIALLRATEPALAEELVDIFTAVEDGGKRG